MIHRCIVKDGYERCTRPVTSVHNWHISDAWVWNGQIRRAPPKRKLDRIKRWFRFLDRKYEDG